MARFNPATDERALLALLIARLCDEDAAANSTEVLRGGFFQPRAVGRPARLSAAEVERLLGLPGIEITYRARLGRDFSVRELEADHDALMLAPGCQEGREWDVRGAVPSDHHL